MFNITLLACQTNKNGNKNVYSLICKAAKNNFWYKAGYF